jgi:hypothetical protein
MSAIELLIPGSGSPGPVFVNMRSGGHRGRLPPELGWRYVWLRMTVTNSAIAKMS